MSQTVPRYCRISARFLALVWVALYARKTNAQSREVIIQGTEQIVAVCKPADLDANVSFFNGDANFTVAFDLRNISESRCVAEPQVAFPMYEPDAQPFGLCTDCEDRLPNGQQSVYFPVLLNPGEIAHQIYRWKTVPPAETIKCLRLSALFTPVLVAAPTLFKQVCSEIVVSRAYPGAFVPSALKDEQHIDEAQRKDLFLLSSRKSRYYQDEMFNLHVELKSPGFGSSPGEECPTFFLRERSPDGATRFDEVRPSGFKTCKFFSPGADRNADWHSGFEVNSGVRSRWTGVGEHSFELFQLDGASTDGRTQFVQSNKLMVQIDDAAIIARKWQGKIKGVGADVTLDKGVYQLGEDVPLHIAIENFDAPVPIYAIDPLWDPYEAIGIEVRDATDLLLPESERSSNHTYWTGHGRGPVPYPTGEVVTIERTLAGQGWLPNRPGVYTVVVTWCTFEGTQSKPNSGLALQKEVKPYATVQATATFRILGEPSSASHSGQ